MASGLREQSGRSFLYITPPRGAVEPRAEAARYDLTQHTYITLTT